MDLPLLVEKKTNWAVVGLGTLAVEEILPAFAAAPSCNLKALVSGEEDKLRHLGKAFHVAEDFQFTYDQYEQILENQEVDVIYIVLPNSMHAQYAVKALKAGKHVLCEKPMAATLGECQAMNDAAEASNAKLMIAYRLQYEPMNLQVVQWMKEERFGRIQSITSCNTQMTTAPDIRLQAKLAGGPIGDIGIYSINAARYITQEEPESVYAISHAPDDSRFNEVPANVTFLLNFASGVHACCTCSFDAEVHRTFSVHCQKGIVTMDPAFSYRGLRLSSTEEGNTTEHKSQPIDQFAAEMEHFAKCILENQTPKSDGNEGIKDLRVIAALHRSIETGCAVRLDDPAITMDYSALTLDVAEV